MGAGLPFYSTRDRALKIRVLCSLVLLLLLRKPSVLGGSRLAFLCMGGRKQQSPNRIGFRVWISHENDIAVESLFHLLQISYRKATIVQTNLH